MKVLHINQSDISGGAAIAAFRLHQNFLNQNIDSRLLVGQKTLLFDNNITQVGFPNRQDRLLRKVTDFIGLNYIYRSDTFKLAQTELLQNSDVIYLHNLHSGYFNYLALPQIVKDKKTIFVLHDMWSFTGHCAYSYDCNRWQSGCGKCPYLSEYPSVSRDATEWEWKLKNWTFNGINMAIVCPSKWLEQCAKTSLLNRHPIYHIPYGIDTDQFHPLQQDQCRKLLDIFPEQKVILTLASNLTVKRKGADILPRILELLPQSLKREVVILTFGAIDQSLKELCGFKLHHLGHLSHNQLKCIAYSASDLFLFPSIADNLPLSVQESLACGTPVVAFDTGGIPGMVEPGRTGDLIPLQEVDEFANKVAHLIQNYDSLKAMRQSCHTSAKSKFSSKVIIQKHIELINSLS